MDRNSLTGNPSAAFPGTLPVDTLPLSDWVSTPEEADGQNLEPLSLLTCQDHQRLPRNLQDLLENLQKASENLQEPVKNVQNPLESVQEPVENVQKLSESRQVATENVWKPSVSIQEPVENLQKPPGSLQEPAENLYPPSGNCQEPDKSHQGPIENIHQGLDTDQKSAETLQRSAGDPEEEQHIFPLDLHNPLSEKPEPGSSPPPLGPNSTTVEPSMSEEQNVKVFATSSGPETKHPPLVPTQLQPPGVCPELNLSEDPAELDPPERSPELHLSGEPPGLRPFEKCSELYSPGDLTGYHPLEDPPPRGNDHQNLSTGPPSAPPQSPAHAAPPSGEPRLCGFLLKLGGPLKTWKQRWFCYEEQKNQLLYYRRPQDLTPLGQVGLSGATFSPLLEVQSSNSFHIHTPQRTVTLKVGGSHLAPEGPSSPVHT